MTVSTRGPRHRPPPAAVLPLPAWPGTPLAKGHHGPLIAQEASGNNHTVDGDGKSRPHCGYRRFCSALYLSLAAGPLHQCA